MLTIPVCHGELVDKLTILRIKMSKVRGEKLENVEKEYLALKPYLAKIGLDEKHELFLKLYNINLEFWEYHDWQREEYSKCDDENLINVRLYRRYHREHTMNDNRARVKKEINIITKSDIIEEKQFISYGI